MDGLHKLDELCTEVREVTESDCVVLMVIVGNHIGYSAKFSCEPHLRTQTLSAIASQLRHIAGEIEADATPRLAWDQSDGVVCPTCGEDFTLCSHGNEITSREQS
jgi:hypothetical protein